MKLYKMNNNDNTTTLFQPLADRMRPQHLDDFVGQSHLLATGKPLRLAVESGNLHSMILWGHPGTGKTTLARLLASYAKANFEMISAVFSGVKDIRAIVEHAKELRVNNHGQKTLLFVDEVHRFNKGQQDAFLPYVENGTIIFIGATTENPSFELNNALLSRARVYVLKSLNTNELLTIIDHALQNVERGYGKQIIDFPPPLKELLVSAADGDARRALNLLEIVIDFAKPQDDESCRDSTSCCPRYSITEEILREVLAHGWRRFDKYGEGFYDQISALHKAVRGSSPDAALYWLARMLDGGCDPLYVARRVVRMASEDIGNADPRALQLALNTWDVVERLGSPEGELAIAQAVVYMACTEKSNAVYTAFGKAQEDVKKFGSLEVPMHLRNAPTKLMKELGYSKNYRYAHDEKDAYAAGENYFPETMPAQQYYYPTNRGLELKIAEKLKRFRELDKH